jgi:hypothetical protein
MTPQKFVPVLAVALVLSLSAKFFLAGKVIGVRYGTPAADNAAAPAEKDRRVAWRAREQKLREKLSPEDQKILEDARASYHGQFATLKQALEKARAGVSAAAMAEPFDQAALEDAVRAESAAKAELLRQMRMARQETLGKLSAEGRAHMEKFNPMDRRPRPPSQAQEDGQPVPPPPPPGGDDLGAPPPDMQPQP